MPLEVLFLAVTGTFGMSAFFTWRFCHPESIFHLLDHPNERSLHTRPTPRTGGIAIVSACLVASTLAAIVLIDVPAKLLWVGSAAMLLAIVSFLDDRVGLSPAMRLVVHLAAASMLLFGGFSLEVFTLPGMAVHFSVAASTVLTLLFVVWMINLYNFMDGMDGFAGGMAVIGFGAFAMLGFVVADWLFVSLNLIVAAAAAGFLVFNFPPARIFMGDAGSSTLGLLAGAYSLWGTRDGIFPFWVALLVFSPFIVDATATLVRRVLRREKVWQAHKTHFYQRLVQLGWGHRKTVLWEYGLMAACSGSAIWSSMQGSEAAQWATLIVWAVIYAVVAGAIRRMETAARRADPHAPEAKRRAAPRV